MTNFPRCFTCPKQIEKVAYALEGQGYQCERCFIKELKKEYVAHK